MRANWKSFATFCIILIAATVAAYWPVWKYDFISYDDPGYVYQNPQVIEGLSRSGWVWAWTTFHCSNWHPLTWLSLQLDGSIGGRNPLGYHATNLLLHVLNCLLLFVVLHRMTLSLYRSALVSALFALHPLHVESVAWISERKDVLSTFFLLLTIWAYVGYAARPTAIRYLSVTFLFILGLLAKPMLVTLPLLMTLLDIWPMNRLNWRCSPLDDGRFPRQTIRRLLIEKVPLLSIAFADGLVTIFAQRDAARSIHFLPLDARIANMFHAYCWYLQKTFAPTELTVLYPHPEQTLSWLLVGTGLLVFCGVTTWVLTRVKTHPHLSVGWVWFVTALLPVIGLLQVGSQAYADRYAYIPHIGLFVAIVWELHAWLKTMNAGRAIGGFVAVAVLATCGVLTHAQVRYWKSSTDLWNHSLDLIPESSLAHAHLGDLLLAEGDHERAIAHVERSLRSKHPDDHSPHIANAYFNWGRSLLALNRPAEAEEKFQAALKIDPNHMVALDELEKLLRKQGREVEAAQVSGQHAQASARKALQKPEDATAQLNLGLAQARQGNFAEAVKYFEKAVQLAPQSADAHNNLGQANADLKRFKEAKRHLFRAIELNPKMSVAHRTLGEIFESENDIASAKKHFADAVRLNPADAIAKQNLGRLSNQ